MLLGIVAIGFRGVRESSVGHWVQIGAALLALISWVWAIIEVQTTDTLEGSQRKVWRIAVIAIPFVGGILYHMLHSKKGQIID